MKQPIDLARKFMSLAYRDLEVFLLLTRVESISDESVGFHAQQVVEKCLKAVLAYHRVEVRKTHDLGKLIDVLGKNGLPNPPDLDILETLTPYAVLFRYDFLESCELDRASIGAHLERVIAWAESQLGGPQ
ncbi:MAG: HEPN domain-containing protein [Desulfomonile tiedjei]|nr:HEPN domain-containing protein [Desulfomonile tiedjei]